MEGNPRADQKNILSGMSIGFKALKERMVSDVLIYDCVQIYEASVVTWPAYKSSQVSARDNKTLKNKILPPELFSV